MAFGLSDVLLRPSRMNLLSTVNGRWDEHCFSWSAGEGSSNTKGIADSTRPKQ